MVGPRWSSKALPEAKPAPRRGHGHCLVRTFFGANSALGSAFELLFGPTTKSLIHYIFLNPGKTMTSEKHAQQIDGMHRKPQRLQPALVKRKGPVLHNNTQTHATQPTLQKLNQLGHKVLPNPPYPPDLLPTDYHFFKQLFEGKMLPHPAENGFQEFIKSWSTDFYATGINQLNSCWQKCIDCNSSYFDW